VNKYNKLWILIGLILAGCQTDYPPLEPTKEGILIELPATWTIEPSATREPTQTKQIMLYPTGTPTTTPTPDFIPPTPPKRTFTFPTYTPCPIEDLPPLSAGEEVQITQIEMVNSSKGWALGTQDDEYFYILYTRDGALSWENRTPPVQLPVRDYSRNDEIFFDQAGENTAWVLFSDTKFSAIDGSIMIWRTDDGGHTWLPSDPLTFPHAAPDIHPGWLHFIDKENGWLFAKSEFFQMHDWSYLFATQDGGITWELVNSTGDSMIENLMNTGIAFANLIDGWVTKYDLGGGFGDPFIEQTHDGGHTWEKILLPSLDDNEWIEPKPSCQSIHPVFLDPKRGALLLQCFHYDEEKHQAVKDNPDSYVYSTSDWGKHWDRVKLSSSADHLFFVTPQIGFAMGRDHFKTIDGGANWEKIKTVSWDGQFSLINEIEGWVIAQKDDQIALLHTSDGGKTYQELKPVISP
jgi:photosystem II stability/assembly factor-like uncharacterized protein